MEMGWDGEKRQSLFKRRKDYLHWHHIGLKGLLYVLRVYYDNNIKFFAS